MKLFDLTLKINGYPISDAKNKLKLIQQIPEKKYEEYVLSRRQAILDYHLKNNPFYKRLIGNKDISDWASIPILTKSDLQQPLEERLSNGFNKKSVYINKTSGSSGTPFVFAKDKFCHALTWANIIDKFGNLGINFNTSFQARFYGIPLDLRGYYKERAKDYFSNRYRFPVFDLSDNKMEDILKHFKKKKIDYINGYTSSIVLFAKYLKSKNLILKNICPTLKYCIVTSEMLFDDDKELMKNVFGVPIINEYGASELDLIAFTNTKDEFIVNNETLFIEIIDENNKVVPNGNPGRIVITSLYNKAHPMIRYEIGDIGVLSKKSSFKKAILEKLIGRTNDIAKLPSGKIVPGLTFYYITKSVISNDGNVKEFIIEQEAIDTFKIVYTSNAELSIKEKEKITKASTQYLEKNLKFHFVKVDVLERTPSGKLKQFVSLVNQ